MNNEKKMSDFFTGIEAVFNPDLTYTGNYPVSVELLECCSKIENNKNLVSEYLKRKYLNNIQELVPIKLQNILLVSDENLDTTKGRVLKVSLVSITTQVCYNLTGEIPEIEDKTSNPKQEVKDFFKNYKLAISSLLKNETNHEVKDNIQNLKNLFTIYLNNNPKNLQIDQPKLFINFLENIRKKISSFLIWYDKLTEICEKPIDLKELEKFIDLEKFYFIMAKHLLEISKFVEQDSNSLHNSFTFVDIYMQGLIALKKENNYHLSVTMPLLDGTMSKVTTDSLIKEYIELKNRHPEFQTFSIKRVEGINYQDQEVVEHLTSVLEDERNAKKLAVSWKLFKKGEKEKSENTSNIINHIKKLEKTKEQKNSELRKRIDFFETSPYLYRVEGINNFEGYLGYIYANNLVIFERFYKDTKNYEPADNNATYIMTLNNFIDMSKLSKPEIIQYIKAGNTDVARKYHTNSWENKMSAVIEGKGYDMDTIQIIDELIGTHQLEKKGVTK